MVENPSVQLPEGNGLDCRPMRLAVINGGHFHITRVSQNWQLALILGHFGGSEYKEINPNKMRQGDKLVPHII